MPLHFASASCAIASNFHFETVRARLSPQVQLGTLKSFIVRTILVASAIVSFLK